jgi:hypothetical protein
MQCRAERGWRVERDLQLAGGAVDDEAVGGFRRHIRLVAVISITAP